MFALFIIIGYFIYSCLSLAQVLETSGDGYISDECWYVSSARNILEKVFGVLPNMDMDGIYASIFVNDSATASAIAESLGIKVIHVYERLPAIYVSASAESIYNFCKVVNVSDIVYGWRLPDTNNINRYFNLEHPPMAKYLIGLSMFLFGDRPFYWRMPNIFAGAVTLILLFMLARTLASDYLALLIVGSVSIDPLFRNMSVIAMLDIWTALFTVLAGYFLVKRLYDFSVLSVAIGATFKFTALTFMFAIILSYVLDMLYRGSLRIKSTLEFIGFSVLAFIMMYFATSSPLIAFFNVERWFYLNFILIFLSTKIVGHPYTSTPWEWFFGIKPFPLLNRPHIVASGNIAICALTFILMLFEFPSWFELTPSSKKSLRMLAGTFLGYMLIFVTLRRDMFSFYMVQMTPLVYVFFTLTIFEYITLKQYRKTLELWLSFILPAS